MSCCRVVSRKGADSSSVVNGDRTKTVDVKIGLLLMSFDGMKLVLLRTVLASEISKGLWHNTVASQPHQDTFIKRIAEARYSYTTQQSTRDSDTPACHRSKPSYLCENYSYWFLLEMSCSKHP